jgi:hypothetical protein
VGKIRKKKTLEIPRYRWEDIKMDVRGIGWNVLDWTDLAHDWDK